MEPDAAVIFSFLVPATSFPQCSYKLEWNAYYRNSFLNAWMAALDCTEYSLRILSYLNIFCNIHCLLIGLLNFCVINQNIPLDNGSILALYKI